MNPIVHEAWLGAIDAVHLRPERGFIAGNPCLRNVLRRPDLLRSGLWVECGVYRGETLQLLNFMRGTARLVGFDTFTGLPEEWKRKDNLKFPAGTFACEPPEVAGAELVAGLFQDTLPGFDLRGEPLTFLHVDCDIYSAAACVLSWAQPHLCPGAVIVFDELVGYPGFEDHEWKALGEAFDRGMRWEWLAAAGEGVAIRVVRT